jgi:hypothetical protein
MFFDRLYAPGGKAAFRGLTGKVRAGRAQSPPIEIED